MSENENTETSTAAAPATLEEALALIEFQPVRDMVAEKLGAAIELIRENNSRVLQIREAKDTDPNNVEYLDNVWKRVIQEGTDDKEMIQAEKRFQAAAKAYEAELAKLRAAAKARHIQPPMSDEDRDKLKKLINDGKPVIAAARTTAESFAEMADKMLVSAGKPLPEGGVIALLPETETLMNVRGRKSASGGGTKSYSTRLVDAFIDGKSTNVMKKNKSGDMAPHAHFNYVANELSKEFGSATFPENEVTSEEIEQAYYDSKEVTFRKSEDMPEDYTFEFKKDVKVQNGNDDSTKVEPHIKKVRIVRWTADTAGINKQDDAKQPADNAEQPTA